MPADESSQPDSRSRLGWRLAAAFVLLAVLLRLAALLLYPENMHRDIDAYLSIARQVAAGFGFSVPGTDQPTAFRPPLYPLMLALTGPQATIGRVLLHLILSGLTISFVWKTATNLDLSYPSRCLAVGLLAVDPLLIWYTTFPMTEAVCTCLSAWMLARLSSTEKASIHHAAMTGVVFGLCVLSRPTYWIWGGLLAIWGLRQRKESEQDRQSPIPRSHIFLATCCGVMLTVSPWVLRNWLVMGTPIVMTTHGGYTLLLANNPNFYAEVVEQPAGTTWSGEGLARWTAEIQQQMQQAGVQGELEADRWQGQTAKSFILSHPTEFLRACRHRVKMFWNIAPSGEAAAPFPKWLLLLVSLFYAMWWIAAVAGLAAVLRRGQYRWSPVLLLIISFTAVHAVYWSNMRLRAPVLPGVALLASVPLTRRPSR